MAFQNFKSRSNTPSGPLDFAKEPPSGAQRATIARQKGRSRRATAALLRPRSARFQPPRVVNNIQISDYQHAGNIPKIRVFSLIRLPDENNVGSEPEKQQIV
ncbi:hypothetical protein HMPREF6485_2569 [Segatella buccae ATCC 33574]|uniref:Uncharacterized protein n=1 Tax=Segatella buccae ATCC 33574 TaxID=873513 RepID=E6KAD3_9BACT|nr:hypothetical protein HMPREF6485_2569 [Segatella buccae ATCC 33574]